MRNVLVLNASFEPLSVVSARRATCLVLADKAEIIESGEELVRSPSFAMNVPLVVRLRYMVKAPRQRRAVLSRRAVFARDDYQCQYCGAHADSIDHIVPRSRGGHGFPLVHPRVGAWLHVSGGASSYQRSVVAPGVPWARRAD